MEASFYIAMCSGISCPLPIVRKQGHGHRAVELGRVGSTERESWNTADSLVSARSVRPGGGKRGKPAAAPFNDSLPTF
jgi:hypothetical protein